MARQQSTHMQAIKIHAKLLEVVRTIANGRCEYIDPNITDQTVAEQLKVGAGTVASIRKQAFGQLTLPRNSFLGRMDELSQKIATLEAESDAQNHVIDNQSRVLAELIQKHNALCTNLAINKVIDVRHLTVSVADAVKGGIVNSAQQRATH